MSRPWQARLSWLMAATAGVAVLLAALRALGDWHVAATLLLLIVAPILVLGLLAFWWIRPFRDEDRRGRSFRRRMRPEPGSNRVDWVLSVGLLLSYPGLMIYYFLLRAAARFLGVNWIWG